MFLLTKTFAIIKPEYEQLSMEVFNFPLIDRGSTEFNDLIFRLSYISKFQPNYPTDKLEEIIRRTQDKNAENTSNWVKMIKHIIVNIIGYEGTSFSENDIEDIYTSRIDIDTRQVTLTVGVLSSSADYLAYLDDKIPDNELLDLFPTRFYRFDSTSYNEAIEQYFPELFESRVGDNYKYSDDEAIFIHNFTFQTTENCNLNCSYCYQLNKTASRMDLETAKRFIDTLLEGEYGYINERNSPAIIIEFIGGDPFLEMPLTRKIYEYFLERTFTLDHPWFDFHRVSMCSNGMLYFDPDVQSFFQDFSAKVSFNISIDGNKTLHDACRVQPNGEGSYDIDMIALKHFNDNYTTEKNSKMTLAPSNISYLFDSVVDFINQGMYAINLNCIFEEGWDTETSALEYSELKKLADYILENNLERLFIAIFSDNPDTRWSKAFDGNFCGGTGAMLSMGPDGSFYPCLRYMPSSLGLECPEVSMGNVKTGMIGRAEGSEILKIFGDITRRSQSNDICYDCPIGSGCAWCSGLCHQSFGTANKRVTFHCIQVIAESLANVYYWNLLNIKKPEYNLGVRKNNVPDDWALKVISQEELEFLRMIENRSMIATLEHQDSNK